MSSIKISAVLLAAGLSFRMGEDKLLLEYQGKSLLQHAIDVMTVLPVYERILISTDARIMQLGLPPGIRSYLNPYPEDGQSGSIRLGIEAATGTHYLFLAADQPKLKPGDLVPLLEAIVKYPDKIIYPTVESKPNSPTVFPAKFKKELLELSGDVGGRAIRNAYPETCYPIEPECPMNFIDIDTMEDYAKLL